VGVRGFFGSFDCCHLLPVAPQLLFAHAPAAFPFFNCQRLFWSEKCGFYVPNALLSQPIPSLRGGNVFVGSTCLHHVVSIAGPLSSEAQSFGLSAIISAASRPGRGLLTLFDWYELKSDETRACCYPHRSGTTVWVFEMEFLQGLCFSWEQNVSGRVMASELSFLLASVGRNGPPFL
jgi:hypothetical protein